MKILYWLPIKYKIIYKICMLTHHATHQSQPDLRKLSRIFYGIKVVCIITCVPNVVSIIHPRYLLNNKIY